MARWQKGETETTRLRWSEEDNADGDGATAWRWWRDEDGRVRRRWEGATEIGRRDRDRTARRRSLHAMVDLGFRLVEAMTLNSGFRLVEAATLNLGRGKISFQFFWFGRNTCVCSKKNVFQFAKVINLLKKIKNLLYYQFLKMTHFHKNEHKSFICGGLFKLHKMIHAIYLFFCSEFRYKYRDQFFMCLISNWSLELVIKILFNKNK